MPIRHTILRIGPNDLCGDQRSMRCPPNAGNSAWAGLRPANVLVYLIHAEICIDILCAIHLLTHHTIALI